MMPGMDGWAVLAALKADPTLADIPVVMLTIVDDRNLGYALGAADYLTKPIDRERLVAVLKQHRARPAARCWWWTTTPTPRSCCGACWRRTAGGGRGGERAGGAGARWRERVAER